jgi:hypothetical protein
MPSLKLNSYFNFIFQGHNLILSEFKKLSKYKKKQTKLLGIISVGFDVIISYIQDILHPSDTEGTKYNISDNTCCQYIFIHVL